MGRRTGVRTTSSRSIQIDFKWQGRRYRERLRLAPTPPNLKYAARLKTTIDHEIATGTFDFAKHFPNSPRKGRGGNLLSQMLRDYCKGLERQLEPETVSEYLLDGKSFIAGVGDGPVGQCVRAKIRTWVNDSPLSKKRLDNILVPVRGMFRQAVEDGILETNPLADFRIRRAPKVESKIDPFTPDELRELSRTELGHLWQFWAWTGLRSGELIGLRWADIRSDLAGMSVRRAVRVGREKATKTVSGVREVVFMPAARTAIAVVGRGGGEDPVFRNPSTGRGWYEDRALARAFRKACQAVGVRYRYPYQLRHTFASWALSAGENPAWVARQMGHRNTLMLFKVYGRWIPQVDPSAGSKMAVMASR